MLLGGRRQGDASAASVASSYTSSYASSTCSDFDDQSYDDQSRGAYDGGDGGDDGDEEHDEHEAAEDQMLRWARNVACSSVTRRTSASCAPPTSLADGTSRSSRSVRTRGRPLTSC